MKTTLLYDKAERPYAQYLIREIQSFKIPRTHKKACVSKAARLHHVQCVSIDTPELSNILKQSDNPIQDEIKLKELELKIKEFELKEKLILKQLEQEGSTSDVAQTLRDIFGNEDNK